MTEKNNFFGKAFGSGSGDVLGLQNIEHICSQNAESPCDTAESENESGKDKMISDVKNASAGG